MTNQAAVGVDCECDDDDDGNCDGDCDCDWGLSKTQTRNSNKLICTRKRKAARTDRWMLGSWNPPHCQLAKEQRMDGTQDGSTTNATANAVGIFVYEF